MPTLPDELTPWVDTTVCGAGTGHGTDAVCLRVPDWLALPPHLARALGTYLVDLADAVMADALADLTAASTAVRLPVMTG